MRQRQEIYNLQAEDFAHLFGTTVDDVIRYCGDMIQNGDFRYRLVEGNNRDQLIIQVLERIFSSKLIQAGEERKNDWERGWRENLDEFLASNYDLEKLIPKYFKKNVPARLNLEYIMPLSPDFVFAYMHVYRTWIFRKYLKDVDTVYEFGCGPAYHLTYLAGLFPGKKLFGLDWATSSQEIITHVAKHYGWQIEGRRFDLFRPDDNLSIERNSAILTFGALEQVGEQFGPFLNFIMRKAPVVCVNVEGLHEFYDQSNLLSYLALQYHTRRGYLSGYFTALQKLEQERSIEIIKSHHHKFGNLYDDSLSHVVWRPIKK